MAGTIEHGVATLATCSLTARRSRCGVAPQTTAKDGRSSSALIQTADQSSKWAAVIWRRSPEPVTTSTTRATRATKRRAPDQPARARVEYERHPARPRSAAYFERAERAALD